MRAEADFPVVAPEEIFDRGFDFDQDINAEEGETILSTNWLCEVKPPVNINPDDLDPNPASHITGPSAVRYSRETGLLTVVAQKFSYLLDNVDYVITARITTSYGQVLEIYAFQKCKARGK